MQRQKYIFLQYLDAIKCRLEAAMLWVENLANCHFSRIIVELESFYSK